MLFWLPLAAFTVFVLFAFVIGPWWAYRSRRSSTRPQFTIRKLLGLTLLFAVLIAVLQAIEHRYLQKSRELEEWRVNANREAMKTATP